MYREDQKPFHGACERIDLVYNAIVKHREVYKKLNRGQEGTDEFCYYLEGLDKALEIIDDYYLSKNLPSGREIEDEE